MSVRRRYTCSGCSAVLARVQLATVLRAVPDVAVTRNRHLEHVRLTCPCGQTEPSGVPQKIKSMTLWDGTVSEQAA